MTLSTEEALTFLKQSSTTTGDTVFTHLSELLRHVLASKPNNSVDILETSFLLKSTRYLSSEGDKPLREGRDPKDVDAIVAFLDLFSSKELPLETEAKPPPVKEKKPDDETETEEGSEAAETETETETEGAEEEPQNEFEAENLYGDSICLEAAGVGLGRAETYFIMLALKKLGDDPKLGVSTVRFFGKFFGTHSNYYVFESTVKDVEGETEEESTTEGEGAAKEAEPPESKFFWASLKDKIPAEEKVGTNLNVYWVCNKLSDKCRRLPDVTPLQIRQAKLLKKYLTGKLDAEVSAYPPFPGLEENFLRAQIARISSSTQLAPNGYFSGGGGDDEGGGGDMTKSEEWTRPPVEELATLDSWVHKGPYIRREGRCTEFELPPQEEGEETQEEEEEPSEEQETGGTEGEEEEETEGDEEEPKPGKEEPEEIPEPLRSIDQDKEISEGLKPWSISLSSSMKTFKSQVICLRSITWPGAYTVATPTGFCNIYIGWGVKNSIQPPPLPPKIMKEYTKKDLQESVELPPQPKKEEDEGTGGDTESQAETEATEDEE